MHSSGMHTAHLLTVSQHALHRGVYPSMHWTGEVSAQGVSTQRGVCPVGCLPRGCLPEGVSAQRGGVCQGVWQTPPCGQNDRHV